MPVVIRMKRTGRRNRPCYRITVTDSRSPRDGKTIERLGLYDPIARDPEAQITLDVERAKHWVSVGAQPSDTVRSIFKRQGVFEGREEPKPRRRPGRKKKTATRERRTQRKAARAELKDTRRKEKLVARRAARKAAAAEGESEG
jgi:small subunit ribosomal protein S16